MIIAIAADHAGFPLKQPVIQLLAALGHQVLDLGNELLSPSDDYPDFAELVGRAVAEGRAQRGIVVCGSGVGASVAANKIKGVRAALCHDTYSARQGVEHDDLNVLCLGGRIVGQSLAEELVRNFIDARYSGEARHARRLSKVLSIEAKG